MTAKKAARPSLAKKVTPGSEAKRDAALNQGVCVTYNDKRYIVRMGDLNSLDSMALRRETGYSWMGLLQALSRDPDIDLFAAVVWLRRRIDGEHILPFSAVASEMGYDSDIDMDDAADVIEKDPNSPEA